MRIAYLLYWDAFTSSGVLTKVETQVKSWNDQGHEARILIVTRPGIGALVVDQSISSPIVIPFRTLQRHKQLKKVASFVAVCTLYRQLQQFKPDLIYQRSCTWQTGFFGRLPGATPYIVELNTLQREELRLTKRMSLFQDIKDRCLLSGAAGLVAVSNEIANHYACDVKPITVVGNGFSVDSLEPRPLPKNQRPKLVFVGTPGQPWHGVDKVVRLAALISEWDFHIVGPSSSETGNVSLPNIHFHGYLQQSQLADIYRQMDIGIGSLALHRNQMTEASPLKVREYVAYGLPVIAGYIDTDLSGADFFLDIGNTEDNVLEQEDKIRSFVTHWLGRIIDRAEVIARVDSYAKETQRLKFMVGVVDQTP